MRHEPFTLADFFAEAKRRRKIAIGIPLLLAAIIAGITLQSDRVYEARAAFAPVGSEPATARFAGLAAQLGVGGGAVDVTRSPEFYLELLRSDAVLRKVVTKSFSLSDGTQVRTGDLCQWLLGKPTNPLNIDRTISELKKKLATSLNKDIGVVTFRVVTKHPTLSRDIAEQLLAEVNAFNVQSRQSQAESERRFVENRLTVAKRELRDAEARLVEFLSTNRQWQGSPVLVASRERLERDVMMQQSVVTSLAQSYETARINEVRNTPVIMAVETPTTPVRPRSRRLGEKLTLALLAGAALAACIIVGLARIRAEPVPSARPGTL